MAVAQKPKPPTVLPGNTKPIAAPEFLRGKPIVSVTEVLDKHRKERSRVFRYTWEGDLGTTSQALRGLISARSGWVVEKKVKVKDVVYSRQSRQGGLRLQLLVMQVGKATTSKKEPVGTVDATKKGWVTIIYNEQEQL